MTRSTWKYPVSKKFLFKNLYFNKELKKQESLSIYCKNCFIFPSFVGLNFNVYDGKKFVPIHILDNMVGHKFGEFVFTRKRVIHKKKAR